MVWISCFNWMTFKPFKVFKNVSSLESSIYTNQIKWSHYSRRETAQPAAWSPAAYRTLLQKSKELTWESTVLADRARQGGYDHLFESWFHIPLKKKCPQARLMHLMDPPSILLVGKDAFVKCYILVSSWDKIPRMGVSPTEMSWWRAMEGNEFSFCPKGCILWGVLECHRATLMGQETWIFLCSLNHLSIEKLKCDWNLHWVHEWRRTPPKSFL